MHRSDWPRRARRWKRRNQMRGQATWTKPRVGGHRFPADEDATALGELQTRSCSKGRPARPSARRAPMDVVSPRSCRLDLHERTVVACLLTPGPRGKPTKEVRTFGTMTDDLLALGDWLA